MPALLRLLPACPNVEEVTLPADILHHARHIPRLVGLLPRVQRLCLRRPSVLQMSLTLSFARASYMPLLEGLVRQLWRCSYLKALAVDWDFIDRKDAARLCPLLNAVVRRHVDVNGLDELVQAMAAS